MINYLLRSIAKDFRTLVRKNSVQKMKSLKEKPQSIYICQYTHYKHLIEKPILECPDQILTKDIRKSMLSQ